MNEPTSFCYNAVGECPKDTPVPTFDDSELVMESNKWRNPPFNPNEPWGGHLQNMTISLDAFHVEVDGVPEG